MRPIFFLRCSLVAMTILSVAGVGSRRGTATWTSVEPGAPASAALRAALLQAINADGGKDYAIAPIADARSGRAAFIARNEPHELTAVFTDAGPRIDAWPATVTLAMAAYGRGDRRGMIPMSGWRADGSRIERSSVGGAPPVTETAARLFRIEPGDLRQHGGHWRASKRRTVRVRALLRHLGTTTIAFTRSGGTWNQSALIETSATRFFPASIALDDNLAALRAVGQAVGEAFVLIVRFPPGGGTPTEAVTEPSANRLFGNSVGVGNGALLVGAVDLFGPGASMRSTKSPERHRRQPWRRR